MNAAAALDLASLPLVALMPVAAGLINTPQGVPWEYAHVTLCCMLGRAEPQRALRCQQVCLRHGRARRWRRCLAGGRHPAVSVAGAAH